MSLFLLNKENQMKTEKYKVGITNFVGVNLYWYEGKYMHLFSYDRWTLYNKDKAIKIAREQSHQLPHHKVFIKNFNTGDILMSFTKGEPDDQIHCIRRYNKFDRFKNR